MCAREVELHAALLPVARRQTQDAEVYPYILGSGRRATPLSLDLLPGRGAGDSLSRASTRCWAVRAGRLVALAVPDVFIPPAAHRLEIYTGPCLPGCFSGHRIKARAGKLRMRSTTFGARSEEQNKEIEVRRDGMSAVKLLVPQVPGEHAACHK